MSKSKVIGEGTYGCVHQPALNCKNKPTEQDKVSKVMTKRDANEEMKEYLLIKKIDPQGNYHLGKPRKCNVDNNQNNIDSINRCKNISVQTPEELNKLNLLIMKHGGYNIENYVDLFFNKNPSDKDIPSVATFLLSFYNIFKGLKLFQTEKIAHHDLKPQNIVYNPKTNKTYFIDFGLMTSYDSIHSQTSKSKYHFGRKCHWSFPYEITLWNKNDFFEFVYDKNKKKSIHADIEHIKKKCGSFFSYLFEGSVDDEERRKYWTKWTNDYSTFLLKLNENDYSNFLNKSIETIDSYGVGIALLDISRRMNHHIEVLNIELNMNAYDLPEKLNELAYNMVHPNLFMRYTSSQACEKYEEILRSSGVIDEMQTIVHASVSKVLKDTLSEFYLSSKKISSIQKLNSSTKFFTPLQSLKQTDTLTPSLKDCGSTKDYNRVTKRCVNKCKPGQVRDINFKCKKDKSGPCANDKERNPKTKRCVKKCKPGYKRNATFKCIKDKKR
jgi:serine/threonine protein kinase